MSTISATREGRCVRTTTRSDRNTASGMLWVTKRLVFLRSTPNPQQFDIELVPGHCIERAERLVQQKDPRVVHQRARDTDALLHAARQFRWPPIREFGEVDKLQQLKRADFERLPIEPENFLWQQNVLENGAPPHQRGRLKHNADVTPGARDDLICDPHLAGRGAAESGNDLQNRGFAAAAGA